MFCFTTAAITCPSLKLLALLQTLTVHSDMQIIRVLAILLFTDYSAVGNISSFHIMYDKEYINICIVFVFVHLSF